MDDDNSNEYLILRHEKVGYSNLLSHLVFRRKLTTSKFVEHKSTNYIPELHEAPVDLVTAFTLLLQKLLSAISTPLRLFGHVLEFFLNLLALNGGFLRIPWRIITASLVIPKRGTATYRSLIGHIDGRYDLQHYAPFMTYNFPLLDPPVGLNVSPLNLSMMAAKLSYENAKYIEREVTDRWKMHFVQFFNCWNKYLEKRATQAFIFCDKAEDANLIVLAFRGTEPFNAVDWITDVDLSWLCMGSLGRAHLGFMRALGLQDEKDINNGFPREYTSSPSQEKPLAYYAIREKLKSLLIEHTNAKILITGHSLGGALAILFPSILAMHDQQCILNSIYGVMTYGQPRVGDADMGSYMESVLKAKYHRMVYRYDLVPRVPFDKPPIAQFRHFGTCIYFKNWYQAQVVVESPNPNYVDPIYQFPMHLSALEDLLRAILLGLARVEDFEEGYVSIFCRAAGILLPGIAFHSPRDYVNSGKMARIEFKIMGKEKKY